MQWFYIEYASYDSGIIDLYIFSSYYRRPRIISFTDKDAFQSFFAALKEIHDKINPDPSSAWNPQLKKDISDILPP